MSCSTARGDRHSSRPVSTGCALQARERWLRSPVRRLASCAECVCGDRGHEPPEYSGAVPLSECHRDYQRALKSVSGEQWTGQGCLTRRVGKAGDSHSFKRRQGHMQLQGLETQKVTVIPRDHPCAPQGVASPVPSGRGQCLQPGTTGKGFQCGLPPAAPVPTLRQQGPWSCWTCRGRHSAAPLPTTQTSSSCGLQPWECPQLLAAPSQTWIQTHPGQ